MEFAINKLKDDEIVLIKKIKSLKDGRPKWKASEELNEIRLAIKLLERYNEITAEDLENEEEYLKEVFTLNPPKAKAQSDYLNKNKFSSINSSMNSNTIVNTIHSIDIERYNSIEEERNKILNDKEFQQWCKDLNIGCRVEVKDYRSNELMQQYTNYPKWVSRQF